MKPAKISGSAQDLPNPPKKKRSETRDRLIERAVEILVNQGIEALTLDAVAQAAEVSKGGLLYHFPNKEALIAGIIQHLIDGFNIAIEFELAREKGNEPGKWLRAYVRATFNSYQIPLALAASLFAAASISLNQETTKKINTQIGEWQQNLNNCGLDPIKCSIIRLAAEGVWSTELFEMNAFNKTLRKQILARLIEMTYEAN